MPQLVEQSYGWLWYRRLVFKLIRNPSQTSQQIILSQQLSQHQSIHQHADSKLQTQNFVLGLFQPGVLVVDQIEQLLGS